MIAAAKKSRVATEVANDPRWRNGWKDSKGNQKNGFWYVFHNNKKVSLTRWDAPLTCTGKKGSKLERDEARTARDKYLETVKVEEPKVEAKKVLTVGDVLSPYLLKHAPSCSNFRFIKSVVEEFLDGREKKERGCLPFAGLRNLPYSELTMKHFDKWEECHPNWSKTGKKNCFCFIKAAINFAMSPNGGKLVSTNPLAGLKLKKNEPTREAITDDEEKIIREFASEAFLGWFDAAIATGARPMELGKATTAHVQKSKAGRLMIVLSPAEWKNGKKTGQARVIPLPEKIEAVVASRLEEAGEKVLPLFVNSRGKKWTAGNISLAFRNTIKAAVKAKKKINPKLSSYCTRHSFITRALMKGASIAILAKVTGTSVAMIEQTYSHLAKEHEVLQSVVDMF